MKELDVREELVLGAVLQILGWILILSSAAMFIKHTILHRVQHVLHMNILIASAGFLLADWMLLLPDQVSCQAFTFMFFVFGCASTFSTTGIALERHRKIVRWSTAPSGATRCILQMLVVWAFAISLTVYPAIQTFTKPVRQERHHGDTSRDSVTVDNVSETRFKSAPSPASRGMCLFGDSMVYADFTIILPYTVFSVFMPIIVMLFCYVRIFKHVRTARLNRWLTHIATQRSQQATAVINCNGRKANVFQVSPNTGIDQPRRQFEPAPAFTRERRVLLKGLLSVCVVIVSWVPSSCVLLYISSYGFSEHYLTCLKYTMLLSKVSVPLNILHYICVNVHYKRLYTQTVMGSLKKIWPGSYSDIHTIDIPSMSDCQSKQVRPSRPQRESMMPKCPHYLPVLTPIIEPHSRLRSSFENNNESTVTFLQSHLPSLENSKESKTSQESRGNKHGEVTNAMYSTRAVSLCVHPSTVGGHPVLYPSYNDVNVPTQTQRGRARYISDSDYEY